jgi:hypothetical protein
MLHVVLSSMLHDPVMEFYEVPGARSIRDPVYELPRTRLPRTRVNNRPRKLGRRPELENAVPLRVWLGWLAPSVATLRPPWPREAPRLPAERQPHATSRHTRQ